MARTSRAKAGETNAPIRTAATRYFLISRLLWVNLPNGKRKSTLFGDLPNQLSVNRVNPLLKLFIHRHSPYQRSLQPASHALNTF